jgi:hypothetical protein
VLDKSFDQCQHEASMGLDESAIQTAIQHPLDSERALCRFRYRGRLALTQKRSERAFGREALGKQVGWFVGNDDNAEIRPQSALSSPGSAVNRKKPHAALLLSTYRNELSWQHAQRHWWRAISLR